MSNFTWGLKEIFRETPKIIKRIQASLNFFCSGIVVFLPWIAGKLHTTTDDLATWLGIFMLGFNCLAVTFGVPPTGTNGNPVIDRQPISNP